MNSDEILLTVWSEVYNCEEYIKDMLEGFLIQKTDFKFQVFIYDDASTDDTSKIIRDYQNKYPDIIKAYISPVNTYRKPERHILIKKLKEENVRGKYYATCEGDDYWTDPLKLQKQVDFLEDHPECSMTIHAAHWIDYVRNSEYDSHPFECSRYLTEEEIIMHNRHTPPTASYVYRINDLDMPQFFKLNITGDYALRMYEFTKGKIYYFDEVMSVYRYGRNGSWTQNRIDDPGYSLPSYFELLRFLEEFNKYTEYKYNDIVTCRYKAYLCDSCLSDPSIPMDEYDIILRKSVPEGSDIVKKYEEQRNRVGAFIRGLYLFDESETKQINDSDHVVIFGCGKYSKYAEHVLKNNNVDFTGYVVSDGQENISEKSGKEVWQLCKYPYDFNKTVFVIGVSQAQELEIRRILKNYSVNKIIDTIWF